MRSGWRWLFCGAAVLLLAACSATQLAYNRLDSIARWRLGDYVELDREQQRVFDSGFAEAWRWHRQQALPQYAAALRQFAGRLGKTPDRSELEQLGAQYGEHWTALLEQLLPIGCRIGPTLSDAQVASIIKGADKDLREYAQKKVEPPPDEQRAEAERELIKGMSRWLGSLTPQQRSDARAWNAARPLTAADWLDFRQRWRDRLAEILADRQHEDFCPRLRTLVVDGTALQTPEQQAQSADKRRRWMDLFIATGASATQQQREHLRKRLLQLAGDFDELSRQGQ